jgi:hypothetical protein
MGQYGWEMEFANSFYWNPSMLNLKKKALTCWKVFVNMLKERPQHTKKHFINAERENL